MKILEFYRTRRYFIRLLLSITLIVAVFLVVFCSVLYYFSKNNAMQLQQESTRKVLRQVNYNIDKLYETVINLTVSTFSDRDISTLMNSQDIEIFDLYNRLMKLDYISNTNLYVHSIYIYNAYNRCYYISPQSTPVSCDTPKTNNLLNFYLQQQTSFPNMKLLPSRIKVGEQTLNLLTMFKQENKSVLMINVKPDWLFDNMGTINDLADHTLGNIMIMDSDNSFFSPDGKIPITDELKDKIFQHIKALGTANGDFYVGSGEEKKIVMYNTSPLTGWKLVSVQSYNTIFGNLEKIGTFSLFILSCFLLLSIAASIFISIKLYKPIGSLIQSIKLVPESREIISSKRDEIDYITFFNQQVLEKLSHLKADKMEYATIAQTYFLRRLVMESESISPEEFTKGIDEYKLNLDAGKSFVLCLLMISSFKEFMKDRKVSDQILYNFAITNISREIITTIAPNEIVNIGNEHMAIVISLDRTSAQSFNAELPALIKKIQDTLYNYYKICITASISEAVDDHQEISRAYEQALIQSEYRMIHGKFAIITPELVAANEQNADFHLQSQLEKKWIESIKSGNLKEIEAQLIDIFKYITTFRQDNLLLSIQYLASLTLDTLKETSFGANHSIKADLLSFRRRVLEKETLDEIFVLFMGLFQDLSNQGSSIRENKNKLLIDAIKEAIDMHYSDPNLSLQSIASFLRMSTVHIGKVFKLNESLSIADYMNEVRISRAMELLQATDITISQIMVDVGYVSESHFYKIFKKSTGLTPKEFRTKYIYSHTAYEKL